MKFKKLFFNILSFGTPQTRIFNLSSILIILAILPTKYLNYSPIKCIFKHFLLPLVFGGNCPTSGLFAYCNCPACGLTRALSNLLHGNFAGAWTLNKLTYIVLPLMVFLIIFNLIKSIKYYRKTGKIF